MKCRICGYESEQQPKFCPNCGCKWQEDEGTAVPEPVQTTPEPIQDTPEFEESEAERKHAFGAISPIGVRRLFLAICILYSVSAGLSLLSGGLPLIRILEVIFLWIIYADVRRDFLNVSHLRCLSGTVFAQYVINWVLVGLFVAAAIFLPIFAQAAANSGIVNSILRQSPVLGGIQKTAVTSFFLFISLILVAIALVLFFFNLFGYKKIHRFLKATYESVESGENRIGSVKGVRICFLILGILCAIAAIGLGSVSTVLGNGSYAAANIITYILIGKLFPENTNTNNT